MAGKNIPHKPTADTRYRVTAYAMVGTPQQDIARLLGVHPSTLQRHYSNELKLARSEANAKVGGRLFQAAMEGNVSAMIFWMKAQAGWREVSRTEVTGADGKPLLPRNARPDFSMLTDEERRQLSGLISKVREREKLPTPADDVIEGEAEEVTGDGTNVINAVDSFGRGEL